jgi:hypothetical protein
MPRFEVYPGIGPHSEELFFNSLRVKQIFTKYPHEVILHSLYECTERSEHTEDTKCPFTVTVRCDRKVNIVTFDSILHTYHSTHMCINPQNHGKYIRNGIHNHNTHSSRLYYDAWFRSVLYYAVQSADPDEDLKDYLIPVSERLR